MENFKDLVKFNRYKSVESFNNATDITSSTLSIVRLDENIMDIYLGRTKITHSNLLKANEELKKLIDSLSVEVKEIDIDNDDYKKSINSIKVKQNTHSQSILDLKSDIKALQSEDIHIFEILDEIRKKLSNITGDNTTPSISDIANIKQNIDDISKELLNKIKNNLSEINKLKTKDISLIEDISGIEKDINALQSEDIHIFEILNGLQSISNTILSDIKFIKKDNENINDEIFKLKEKIKYLTGVNVDSFISLEEADRRLNRAESRLDNLEKSDETFQSKIDKIDFDNKSIKEDIKKLQTFESTTNEKIKLLESQIEEITGVDSDYFDEFNNIEQKINELSSIDETIQQDIEILKGKDDSLIPDDIIVAGLDGKLGAGNYNNGDTIKAGTNMYEILQNILCKELYPANVTTTKASATASMNNLTLSLDKSGTIEVGTLVKLTSGSTNGSVVNKVNSKISNIEYGYSTQDNDIKESSDKYIEKECITEINNNEYTISASIISGFNSDTKTNIKTTPETKSGEGGASLDETKLGCVIEGENKITLNAIGASYSYNANAIDKIYYCSNLGKTNENQYHEGIESISGITDKPTKSTSASVTGKYKYFLGYSENTTFNQFDSDSIRALTVKSGWLNINSNTEVVGNDVIKSNGKSIVIACPNKYKLSSINTSLGNSMLELFSSQGEIDVKTGETYTKYNVYVYPITNNTKIDYKNVKITKI